MDKLATLRWYREMGVDESMSSSTINQLALNSGSKIVETKIEEKEIVMPSVTESVSSSVEARPPMLSHSVNIANLREMVEKCTSLDELKSIVCNFKGLSITKTATNTVFADGNSDAEIMLIGEAPGADEDIQGIPFCGASGQLLDQMLSHIGLSRKDNFYITNTVFWRPPGNRRPTPQELEICRPFVERHIALHKPKVIILVGGTAIASVLDLKDGITKVRGKFFDYKNNFLDKEIKTTAIFHPSYLLRSPGQKKVMWKDLLNLKHYLQDNNIKI